MVLQKYKWTTLIVTAVLLGSTACTSDNGIEIYQSSRDNVIDVNGLIKEFDPEEVLIGKNSALTEGLGKIFIKESNTDSCFVHVFDKNTLAYLGSFGRFGEGPEEITIPGRLQINTETGNAYFFDHGQLKIMAFNVDSVLSYPDYHPWRKQKFDGRRFPDRYRWISDTLGYGRLINIYEDNGRFYHTQSLAKYNLNSGELTPLVDPERHPKAHSLFEVSGGDNMLVEVFNTNDLINIFDLEGNVLHRIYGPDWSKNREDKRQETSYFTTVRIANPYIYASYSGKSSLTNYYGDRIEVFDFNGNYIKTLDFGIMIRDFVIDSENDRLFLSFDGDILFGSLDLNSLDIDKKIERKEPAGITTESAAIQPGSLKDKVYFSGLNNMRIDTVRIKSKDYTEDQFIKYLSLYSKLGEDAENWRWVHITGVTNPHKAITVKPAMDSIPLVLSVNMLVDKKLIDQYPISGDAYVHLEDEESPVKLHVIVE